MTRLAAPVALVIGVVLLAGCSRTQHRLNADREVYCTIAERNNDPRWATADYSIDLDSRSRYFDPYNPDCSPMPLDDPASQRYMRCVDGKKGWKHWYDNGVRSSLENPEWRSRLVEYAEVDEEGAVRLDVDSAVRLAYMHSPLHQRTLETLYLSALDVTGERFRLDTQFFGGNALDYSHNGNESPATISFDPGAGRYVVTGPFDVAESNRMAVGTDLQATRRFATAGELLVGFANSFAFEFTGDDVSLASTLANFSFIQPLLRGAGRDIALEQLTQSERRLLANLRAYSQFRQGFFTQIVVGELGVTGPQRFGTSTSLQSFAGVGFVGGYLGLLQQAQQIRNTEDNLRLQLRTRDRLEALYDNELIDIVQVDQFRQNIEVTRANLLDQTNGLELAVDNYKTQILGLPSDLPMDIDEELVADFQLIPVESNPVLASLLQLQQRIGDVGELSELATRLDLLQLQLATLGEQNIDDADLTIYRFQGVVRAVARRLDDLPRDLAALQQMDFAAEEFSELERTSVEQVTFRVQDDVERLKLDFEQASLKLQALMEVLTEDNLAEMIGENETWLPEMLSLCRGAVLIQWAARDIRSEPDRILATIDQYVEPVRALFANAQKDVERLSRAAPDRERYMEDEERRLFKRDRERLQERLDDLETGEDGFETLVEEIAQLREGYGAETRVETIRGLTGWIQSYLQVTERLSLIPAQARLEIIAVDEINLDPDSALQIALENRLDFMNGRAALVDRWRAIQVAADALQSDLTVTSSGDIRTARNNPFDFRASTSRLRLGIEFDAPLARLLERNGYREALIEYQRSRRNLIQSRDSLQRGLRALLRTLKQRRLQLEIQRRAVSIALRRVDQTQLSLLTPPPQGQPGVRPQINPTTAINLLGAQSLLQSSQNSFLAAWLNYYAARVRLFRELGTMQLEPSGRWIENSADFAAFPAAEGQPNAAQPDAVEPGDTQPGGAVDALELLPPPVPEAVLDELKLNPLAGSASLGRVGQMSSMPISDGVGLGVDDGWALGVGQFPLRVATGPEKIKR